MVSKSTTNNGTQLASKPAQVAVDWDFSETRVDPETGETVVYYANKALVDKYLPNGFNSTQAEIEAALVQYEKDNKVTIDRSKLSGSDNNLDAKSQVRSNLEPTALNSNPSANRNKRITHHEVLMFSYEHKGAYFSCRYEPTDYLNQFINVGWAGILGGRCGRFNVNASKISEMLVPKGYRVTLYSGYNGEGSSQTYEAGWHDLYDNKPQMTIAGFSFKISRITANVFNHVIFYDDTNLKGTALELSVSANLDKTINLSDRNFDNKVSSLSVPLGYQVYLYEDSGKGGVYRILKGGEYRSVGGVMNNEISSVVIKRRTNNDYQPYIFVEVNLHGGSTSNVGYNEMYLYEQINGKLKKRATIFKAISTDDKKLSINWDTGGALIGDKSYGLTFQHNPEGRNGKQYPFTMNGRKLGPSEFYVNVESYFLYVRIGVKNYSLRATSSTF